MAGGNCALCGGRAGGETYAISGVLYSALFSGGELWACVAWGSGGGGRGGLSIGRGRRVERSAGRHRRQIRSRRSARSTHAAAPQPQLSPGRRWVSASTPPDTVSRSSNRIGAVRVGAKRRSWGEIPAAPSPRAAAARTVHGLGRAHQNIHFELCSVSMELWLSQCC